MSVKLLIEHHLEFLSLTGCFTGLSETTLVTMPNCWKSHVTAHIISYFFSYQLSRTSGEGISEIRWLFPIHGIPESRPIKDSFGAIISCQARDRLEERLEVTLAGVAPSTSGQHKTITTRSVTPKNAPPKVPNSIVVGESEFSFYA